MGGVHPVYVDALKGQKRASDPLELDGITGSSKLPDVDAENLSPLKGHMSP